MTEWRAAMRSGVEPTPDWQETLCEVQPPMKQCFTYPMSSLFSRR